MYEREGLLLIENEPSSITEALKDKKWFEAMELELSSIERNKTWKLTQLPKGKKVIGLKWLFKLKKDAKGNITKYKARLVAKGYAQSKGVDYEEVFAPVARIESIRFILAMAASKQWRVHHLDVKSAFLNGDLHEEVYVRQPEGFEVNGKEEWVYKLNKALYGLKQAPRMWNSKLDQTLKEFGFVKCVHEPAVYTIKRGELLLVVGVYVDDLIVTGSREKDVVKFKELMKTQFAMSDLGLLTYYLGIEVNQGNGYITLNQTAYAKKLLKFTGMESCNASSYPMEHKLQLTKDEEGADVDATMYRRVVGSLRYLLHTRPDLSYSVGVVSRFMGSPKESHFSAMKHILRYVRGSIHMGLKYEAGGDGNVVGFCDSSHGDDKQDRKGTTGSIFYYSGNVITWLSQKQRTVALSSCEAEFMAASSAACQALWLRSLVSEIMGSKPKCVKLFVDNEAAIALMKNPVFHGRSKHIDTRYHFIRDCVEDGSIEVDHVCGKLQKADGFTKALPRLKFMDWKRMIGMHDLPHQGEYVG